jgi:predicted  nucleic acid-binding Zn-ribbon protein
MKITVPVSVGELLDKITILEIKSKYTDNEYVIKELNDLNEIRNTLTSYTMEYMDELRDVNQKLWDIEDRIRELEEEYRFDDEFISLARQVYITNDKRAEIKRKINDETNSNYKEIKLY